MPVRATKRGSARTAFDNDRDADVIICGASFAGLTVARELRGLRPRRVLVLDRYEIGERATSACAVSTNWLINLGLEAAIRQTFHSILVSTPRLTVRMSLPIPLSTFDYRALCRLLWEQCDGAEFDTATVRGRDGQVVHTDRGDVTAPLIVDALGWRRVLGAGVQPPDARLTRGLEVHPAGGADDMVFWFDTRYVRPGYSWLFPAGDELRVGVASYDPRTHVKDPTVRLAVDKAVEVERFQGNWIPHELRPATEDGVFFVGDSAGHCYPLTAEGIRPAFYYAVGCGRELRAVLEGRQSAEQALERYAALGRRHATGFARLLRMQHAIHRSHGLALDLCIRTCANKRFAHWLLWKYIDMSPPRYALPAPPRTPVGRSSQVERSVA